jgi:hypothetical protein
MAVAEVRRSSHSGRYLWAQSRRRYQPGNGWPLFPRTALVEGMQSAYARRRIVVFSRNFISAAQCGIAP